MIFISVILVLICIAASYFVSNYWQSIKTVKSLPGPRTFPFIGNAHYFFQRNPEEFLYIINKLIKDYPSPFQFWMRNKLFIHVYEQDQIKTISHNSHCLNKSMIYKFIEPIFGEGLLTASESKWLPQRKMILRAFSRTMLQKFFNKFVEHSLMLTDELGELALNKNEIIIEHISKHLLDTACDTLMGIKLEPLLISQCLEKIIRCKKIFTYRMQNVCLYSDFIFNFTAAGREMRKNINFLHFFTDKIIQQKYALNKLNIKNKSEQSETLLDILMEKFDEEKFKQVDFVKIMHDNILTILLAATDTTANTLNFVIFMMANFPEKQERVYKELWEIYETKSPKSNPVKYEDLQHMNYLDNLIKETMRLFPVIPIIGRQLMEDIKIGEIILPKGTDVIIHLMTALRNEKYWPDPLIFDPDRFLSEKMSSFQKNFENMPFSLGRRNCIGMTYAKMLMKVILAILIRTFVFKVDKSIPLDKIKLYMNFTLDTIEPIKVKIEKRDLH